MSRIRGLAGKRPQNVIGFKVFKGDNWNPQCLQDFDDSIHLGPHLVRHCVSSRLVFSVLFVPPRIPLVKRDCHTVGPEVSQNTEQLAEKAKHSRGRLAPRGYQRRSHTEKGSICLRMAVNEQVFRHCRPPCVYSQARSQCKNGNCAPGFRDRLELHLLYRCQSQPSTSN